MVLKEYPGHLARRLHQMSTLLFDLEMRKADLPLTPVQYAALVTVRDNPKVDQATLASLISYDRTTIGGVVDRLVDKGFINRISSDLDRRSKLLTVSDLGKDIIEKADPAVERAQARLVQGLTPSERDQLVVLMEKVVSELGELSRSNS
jgi:DNA-binding MarR family transcriptional regulator